eukprot:6364583-Pyramimonas_sp.AAC.1
MWTLVPPQLLSNRAGGANAERHLECMTVRLADCNDQGTQVRREATNGQRREESRKWARAHLPKARLMFSSEEAPSSFKASDAASTNC